MKKTDVILIIEAFGRMFPDIELSFEQETEILNRGVEYDTLVIVPKINSERLMFLVETECMIEINSFIKPNEFCLLDLNRRQEDRIYVLYLKKGQGNKEKSLTLFEGLVGFLTSSLTNAYCSGCSLVDSEEYPYFFHDKINGGLVIGKISDNNELFLEKYIIEK